MEVAHDPTFWDVNSGVCYRLFNLSNSSLMEWLQSLFVCVAAFMAAGYLIYKWMPKSKTKKGGSCGTDCNCH